jgi:hypothetical protein
MEDNIITYNNETGWDGVGWIGTAQGREMWQALVNIIRNLWVS